MSVSEHVAAAGIRVGYDAGGDIHIELLDDTGAVFGRASMSREQLANFMGQCADVAQAISIGGLALMPAGGHA